MSRTASHLLGLTLVCWLTLSLAGCADETPPADPATARSIADGEIVGTNLAEGAVHAWRGIPYAQPPVGALRWRAPRPPEPWEGVRETLVSGSRCVQLGGDPIEGSEDCLYLDVYAPAFDEDRVPTGAERRPVMFWIHGGGNSMGWGDQTPPTRLAAENDVIVVTINYRLGLFGWLSHPFLREAAREGDRERLRKAAREGVQEAALAEASRADDASGNFGTLDMIRALEWVQSNIARFGGDPNRVTIFGESAGGVNVFSLLLSPRATGLFHAAISQSGVLATMTRTQAEHYTDTEEPGLPGSSGELLLALLEQTARAEDRASAKTLAASMSPAETEAFLRSLSAEELLAPFVAAIGDSGMPIYVVPTVIRDGHVIPDADPLELLGTAHAYNAVPFIAGTNREESKLFLAMSSPLVSRIFGLPTGIENERLYDVEGEYGGLVWRAQGADQPISAMRLVQGPSVWAYRFDWDEEGSLLGLDLSKLLGAAHAMDLLFVFGLTDLGWANGLVFDDLDSARELSQQMRSYWASFAHGFRPGRGQDGDLPDWKPWNPARGKDKYMIFDSARDGGLRLGTDEIDQAFVLHRAVEDPRLLDDEERCGIFENMVKWSSALSVEQYAEIADGACRAYPLDSRLPFGSISHMNATVAN